MLVGDNREECGNGTGAKLRSVQRRGGRSLEDGGGLRQYLAAPWGKAGLQLTLSPFPNSDLYLTPHTLLRFRTQGPSDEGGARETELLSSALRTHLI